MASYKFLERFRYGFDNLVGKGTPVLVIGLFVTFFTVALLTGLIVYFTHINKEEGPAPGGFPHSYWMSLMHVLDQGTITGEQEAGWTWKIVMLITSIIGILLISTLVSIISAGFQVKIEEIKKGKSKVLEENHTVILGWSSKIFPIISELMLANLNQGKSRIVILADKDKTEMEDEIKQKIGRKGNTKIICRRGNTKDLDDLKIANLNECKSIIILSPEDSKSDTYVIKTVLAIVNNPERKKAGYNIVAEIKDSLNNDIAKIIGKEELTLLNTNEVISKIMVQTSRQSGLSIVYNNLLGYSDMEIYIQEARGIEGRTFKELLFSFEDASVFGIRRKSGEILINPPLDTKAESGDKLIIVAEDDDELRYESKNPSFPQVAPLLPVSATKANIHRTLILGWNENAHIVLEELDNYVMPGSEVMIYAEGEEEKEEILEMKYKMKNQSLTFYSGDINDRSQLNKLEITHFDHIIILSYYDRYPVQEADAITLIALVHLRDILQKANHKVSVVTEMLDMKNRALADLGRADDFIISDRIISLILAQLSENRELSVIFDDLFDADGNEIYLKSAIKYTTPGVECNFYTILDNAIKKGHIPIGYRLKRYSDDPSKGYGVVLNPHKSAKITLYEDDQVIVIAED